MHINYSHHLHILRLNFKFSTHNFSSYANLDCASLASFIRNLMNFCWSKSSVLTIYTKIITYSKWCISDHVPCNFRSCAHRICDTQHLKWSTDYKMRLYRTNVSLIDRLWNAHNMFRCVFVCIINSTKRRIFLETNVILLPLASSCVYPLVLCWNMVEYCSLDDIGCVKIPFLHEPAFLLFFCLSLSLHLSLAHNLSFTGHLCVCVCRFCFYFFFRHCELEMNEEWQKRRKHKNTKRERMDGKSRISWAQIHMSIDS